VISRENLTEPKLVQGLESEIKIMQDFEHENIVRLHEFFSTEKNFYLVLELCMGGDLNKFIRKQPLKYLDERVAHGFLLQLANGLAFLQEKNFIHRDLKPANVLLSEFSNHAVLKLADFGFARHLAGASLAQTRCGTPLFMAPEILECREYDAKADIWSVGCIFYEMLVGVSPFKGTNENDLLHNIKTKELSVPNHIVITNVSIEILVKLLDRNPLRRASLNQLHTIAKQLPLIFSSDGSMLEGHPPVQRSQQQQQQQGHELVHKHSSSRNSFASVGSATLPGQLKLAYPPGQGQGGGKRG
jgi:serine/threonine-protein kinase ULK/ATG1